MWSPSRSGSSCRLRAINSGSSIRGKDPPGRASGLIEGARNSRRRFPKGTQVHEEASDPAEHSRIGRRAGGVRFVQQLLEVLDLLELVGPCGQLDIRGQLVDICGKLVGLDHELL